MDDSMKDDMKDDMKDLIEGFTEGQGYSQRGKWDLWRTVSSFDFRSHKRSLLVAVIGIFVVIFFFRIFFKDDSGDNKENQGPMQATPDQVEEKITRLQRLEEKIARIEREVKEVKQAVRQAIREEKSSKIELEAIGKKLPASAARTSARLSIQKMALSGTKSFHEVSAGDSLSKIAEQYGLSVPELCHLNNLTRDQIIHPGQKLLISTDSNR